jgi:hypothetical protein
MISVKAARVVLRAVEQHERYLGCAHRFGDSEPEHGDPDRGRQPQVLRESRRTVHFGNMTVVRSLSATGTIGRP